MKYLKVKDLKRRIKLKKTEVRAIVNKYSLISYSKHYNFRQNFLLSTKIVLNRTRLKTRLSRRCILTNRNKVSNKYFNICRNAFNQYVKFNKLFGYKKAVW